GNFEKVLRRPHDLDARGAMQLGAFLAGCPIENSMLGAAHACANPLTAHYGLTHGVAIVILLPLAIRFNAPATGKLYVELAEAAKQEPDHAPFVLWKRVGRTPRGAAVTGGRMPPQQFQSAASDRGRR